MCFRPPEASMNDHNVCEACGTENPPGEEACFSCGARLVKKEAIARPVAPASEVPRASGVPLPPKAPPRV